ncbi:MAG: methyltransferase domain-containing protein [Clostridia bacterium]|nr:methyltransferase domain-containing protein [Clostridia bacterium]
MHHITELPAWERLFKRIVWEQTGTVEGMRILDFGSGEGVTADHFAGRNEVIAVEPSEEMLSHAWKDHPYTQITGDADVLASFPDGSFDMIICHNVLEYIEDKKTVLRELTRILKRGGTMSVVKHNRAGRVMQMAVLLDDHEKAHALLDGENSHASRFGIIRYYDENDIPVWSPELQIEDVYGIRTFWDLQQNQQKHEDEAWQSRMMQLEMRVSRIPEYRSIAFFHHVLLKKRS